MSVLGVILCRKGSKRLPGKNMKLLNGKPMIQYTIDAALESGVIDTLVVSTDDEDIKDYLYRHCGFTANLYNDSKRFYIDRPEYLATDTARSEECLLHVMDNVEKHDYVMLLQVTSPLRTGEDIKNSMRHIDKMEKSIITHYVKNRNIVMNGAIYISSWEYLYYNRKFELDILNLMPEERSIDIDTIDDFKIAEMLLKERDNGC